MLLARPPSFAPNLLRSCEEKVYLPIATGPRTVPTMAYSPAPVSPTAGAIGQPVAGSMNARGRSMSPPTNPPLSKRDKRRTALQERLQDLTASFSQNRDAQFRQQLHALQCDMTLINNADPYTPGPLPDSPEEIARLIENTVGGGKFGKEMASVAGTWYARFVQEINQVKEETDAELALLVVSQLPWSRSFKPAFGFFFFFSLYALTLVFGFLAPAGLVWTVR